jgi:alpha-1,6-mannosyltransferase
VHHATRLALSQRREGLTRGARLSWRITAGWVALGLLVAAFGVALTLASPQFGYAYDVAEMPVPALVAGLVEAGLVFCLALTPLIRSTLAADAHSVRLLTVGIVVAGVAARLVLFASEPMLEDDYQRYLWDGAVTAHAANPYSVSPLAARGLRPETDLGRLALEAGPVVARINHPDLKTVYPPVAQAAFALAHLIRPWSLTAWRTLLLVCDLATLALILALLRETGRSPLWSALYWWNPLVLKELFNSAHMDAAVLPFALLALLLAVRGRHIVAGASLALAVGAKIWPVLLLPLLLRPLAAKPRTLAVTLLVFGALVALLAMPVLLGGLDGNSGFAAYAARWQTSSAHFPALQSLYATLLVWLGLADASAGLMARMTIALTLGGLSCALGWKRMAGADDLIGRASLVVAALVLLSPAQFPWYAVWFAPFLAFRPWAGFLVLTATAPLYYMSFYLTAAGEPELFQRTVVWLIWLPVWAALAIEAIRYRTRALST